MNFEWRGCTGVCGVGIIRYIKRHGGGAVFGGFGEGVGGVA